MFEIAEDCFESTMKKKVGYEASLANISYDIENVDECALDIEISGFSQKIFNFAELFIDMLLDSANTEFDHLQVLNSLQKLKNEYANANVEVTDHTTNNRNLFLYPHTFHSSLIKKELEDMLALSDEEK